jgi:putative oxidoreductase
MPHLSRLQGVISWVFQVVVAVILLQTLFFKFTGAEESRYIFSEVGRFVGVTAVEPWGRIGSGVIELVASMLLLVPSTAPLGAILTMGVMSGAIASHLVILGFEVKGDGGLLFALALIAFAGSMVVFMLRRSQLPAVVRFFQAA